jgi:sRNA-binding protein
MCKTEAAAAAKSKPLSEEEMVATRRQIEERVARRPAPRRLQAEAKREATAAGAAASTSVAKPSTSGAAPTGPPAVPTADDDEECALPGRYEAGQVVFHIGEAPQPA